MAAAKTPTCGWSGCSEEPVAEVALDRGSETCKECGAEKTHRAVFKLCEEHNDQYTESGDVTMLLLSAKEA